MADKIKAIKIKQKNGTYSEEVPISVNVQNVQWDENNHTLLDALGSVDISSSGKGNLQHQIDELDGDKISTNQFNSRLNDFLREQISEDTTDWLDDNVNPVGSAVIIDKTLTIEGAAADALAVKTELNKKANASNTYTKAEVNAAIDAKQIEVDDTLSITGTAADAKAVGDKFTEVKADLDTLADITPIPDNSDLNDYTETGLYSIENSNYTILNYPDADGTKLASTLEVKALTTGYIQQIMTKGAGRMFARTRFGNGNWNDWVQLTYLEPGLSADEKRAIVACFENSAWANTNGKTVLDTLKTLWSDVLPKYADLKYPNGDIVVKTNHHLIKGTNNVISSESSNYFKVIGINEKCDDTSPIAFEGLYGISIKGYSSITPTYSMVNPSNNTDIILMVTRIENGVFYVVSMGAHLYSGDSIDISGFINKDYYAFFNMRDVDIRTDVASLSIALQ